MATKLNRVTMLFLLAAVACYRSKEEHASSRAGSEASTEPAICVAQYVSHPALDQVLAGFREEAQRKGVKDSQVITYNANGDKTAAEILSSQLCTEKCSVIFALATPMAQSLKSRCPTNKPIVFGAITDPISAGLVSSMDKPGGNLTGTSDQWPYMLQMKLIAEIWGKNVRIGVPFNPAEANTEYAMQETRKAAQAARVQLEEAPVNSLTEAAQAVDALAGKVDVIYIPADNTVMAAARGIITAAERKKIPVIAGDPGTFDSGAPLGLGVSYKNLGIINAQQTLDILSGLPPGRMPVEVSNRPELFVSEARAKIFNIDTQRARIWYQRQMNHDTP